MARRRIVRTLLIATAVGTLSLSTACARYRVTDTTSGQVYYTKHINKRTGGAVTFKDAETGEKVTLDSHEIEKINKQEFRNGAYGDDDDYARAYGDDRD